MTLDTPESSALWREVRDAAYFTAHPDRQIWRLSVPPASGAKVVERILDALIGHAFYDWGGGLIWLALVPPRTLRTDGARRHRLAGGHATLIRAAAGGEAGVPVFSRSRRRSRR